MNPAFVNISSSSHSKTRNWFFSNLDKKTDGNSVCCESRINIFSNEKKHDSGFMAYQ